MSVNFEKYYKDGSAAVLVSPGFGAGWSTWAGKEAEAIMFDKNIVEFVRQEDFDGLEEYMQSTYPDVYLGGMKDLVVEWVPEGEAFEITEYDGSESLNIISEQKYWIA